MAIDPTCDCSVATVGPPSADTVGPQRSTGREARVTTEQSPRQPWLHDLRIIVDGNATALSATTGDVSPGAGHGLFVDDVRLLSRLELTVSGEAPSAAPAEAGGATAEFFGAARGLGDEGPDPTVEVRRLRTLEGGGTLHEDVTVTSRAARTPRADLRRARR